MRILFFALHWGYLRHYDDALRSLAEAGHELYLVAEKEDRIGSIAMIEDLCDTYPAVHHGFTPDRRRDPWLRVGTWIRLGLDYLRYLRPEYAHFKKLYQRSRSRTPRLIVWLTDLPGMRRGTVLNRLETVLHALEQLLPMSPEIESFIRGHEPDAVLLTPLLGLGTSQYDDLRAAKDLEIKTVLCVGSWDHLSSKALIRFAPDLVTVWNDTQKREAIEMHDIPADRIAVTGAQGWDRWFDREPARDRRAFCADVGLDPDRPFFLWLCSTPFPGSDPEAGLVHRWIRYLRNHDDPRLQRAGILVRPHPQRLAEWEDFDLSPFENVVLHGDNPVTERSRDDYFDSMYHCAGAIGLNTSAMIEAGILGKSVHTILAPEFRDSQIETVHFHYLREVGGGLLHEAATLEENAEQLLRSLERQHIPDPKSRRFTEAFVRPHGLDEEATARFVAAVEDFLRSDRPPVRYEPAGSPGLRRILRPVLVILYVTVGMLQATPLGMRIHRGKKLVRAGFLRIAKVFVRTWGRLRKVLRYLLKDLRLAVYRAGKVRRLATHRARKKARSLFGLLRMQGHRLKKKLLAGQRLLSDWLGLGGSSIE